MSNIIKIDNVYPSIMTTQEIAQWKVALNKAIAKSDNFYEKMVELFSLPAYAREKAIELTKYRIDLYQLSKAFPDDAVLQNELMPLIFGKDENNEPYI